MDQVDILLVEDHIDTARLMAKVLASQGHIIRTAHSRAEAIAASKITSFDLLVTDLRLPDGQGHDLMKIVRARVGIVVSGSSSRDDEERILKAGFAMLILKPIDLNAFLKVVNRLDGKTSADTHPV